MIYDTREEADDYIAQLIKDMIVVDTSVVDGVEKTLYALETNGVDDKCVEIIIAPAGTQFDEDVMTFLREEEEGVELIFGDLEDYTSDRIVIVSDLGESSSSPVDSLDDELVDPDQIP